MNINEWAIEDIKQYCEENNKEVIVEDGIVKICQ